MEFVVTWQGQFANFIYVGSNNEAGHNEKLLKSDTMDMDIFSEDPDGYSKFMKDKIDLSIPQNILKCIEIVFVKNGCFF